MPTYRTAFISHAHADNVRCASIAEKLCARGINVWIDLTNLQTGHALPTDITRELVQRQTFVLMLTPTSDASPWVGDELNKFLAYSLNDDLRRVGGQRRLIIPVRMEPITIRPGAEESNWAKVFDRLWIDGVGKSDKQVAEEIATALMIASDVTSNLLDEFSRSTSSSLLPGIATPSSPLPPLPDRNLRSPSATFRTWLWTYCLVAPLAFYLSLLAIFTPIGNPSAAESGGWLQTYVITLGLFLGLAPLAVSLVCAMSAHQPRWLLTILFIGGFLVLVSALLESGAVGSLSNTPEYGNGLGLSLLVIVLCLAPMFVAPVLYSFWGLGTTRNFSNTTVTVVCLVASWLFALACLVLMGSLYLTTFTSSTGYTASFILGAPLIGSVPAILAIATALQRRQYAWSFGLLIGSLLFFVAAPLVALIYFTTHILQYQRPLTSMRP